MIVTYLDRPHLMLPLRHCPACGGQRPAYQCTGHRICACCGLVTLEPQEAVDG